MSEPPQRPVTCGTRFSSHVTMRPGSERAARRRDYPDFAQFLVEEGIDSISLTPDTVLKTALAILEKENALRHKPAT